MAEVGGGLVNSLFSGVDEDSLFSLDGGGAAVARAAASPAAAY